jgi:CBS domain containing-hemolysin-like protein
MSDPSGSGSPTEKPQKWISRAWDNLRTRWRESAEVEALRDAVDDLIEAEPESPNKPVAEQVLLTNILKLRTREAGDCMIPRADIQAVDMNATPEQLIATMAACKHSRIPIYRDTLDDIIGMVHMKDVLLCMAANRPCVISDMIRPVLIVVPSMAASQLLLQMRTTRQHMAVVVDEFGGVDGLVTIEDLVEEIVGEIEDEHDTSVTPTLLARADGTLLVDARLPIHKFEKRIGKTLLSDEEREEIDTVGGFVFHIAGHVPKIGEKIHCRVGLEFEILEANESRINRVRVRKTPS